MDNNQIVILYITLLSAEFLFSLLLQFLNLHKLKQAQISGPYAEEWVREHYDRELFSTALVYNRDRTVFSILALTINIILIFWLVLWGIPGIFEDFFIHLFDSFYIVGIGTVFSTAFLITVPGIALRAYSVFVIEERHGFNRMNCRLFIQDIVKSGFLTLILALPLSFAILWRVRSLGPMWWLYSFMLTALLQLLIVFVFPVLIAPLFYRFTPLEDGPLKERLQVLTDRTGFIFKSIQVIDGSRRSAHSNAFFSGFGSSRRIALFDTLMDSLSNEQIEAVVAHELGHAALRHTIRQVVSSLFILFGAFALLGQMLNWDGLFPVFGFQSASVYALLVIVLFFSSPVTFWLSPLSSFFSRRREYAADAFAQEYCGDYRPLADGLVKLHQNNKSNPVPHPLYSFFHFSHPTVPERIAAMKKRSLESGRDTTSP
jgi:STE24 endopeptidase